MLWPIGRRAKPRRAKGRVLAVKMGLNPNSSSLGVDVTFLLFGAAALSVLTPVVSALIRLRKPTLIVGEPESSGATDSAANHAGTQN